VDFNFSQAIADNVEEAMSGVKGENTVKVWARSDSERGQGAEIVSALQHVRGVEDLGMFRSLGPARRQDRSGPRALRAATA